MDAHGIRPDEYDEIPELTDAVLERADLHVGDRLIRPGAPGKPVAVHLLPEVVAHFRQQGPGWQSRINAALMDIVARERAMDGR